MAKGFQILIGSVPTLITSGLKSKSVIIQNLGPYRIFIGDENVTDKSGIEIPPDGIKHAIPIDLTTLESIYGIIDPGAGEETTDVRVLATST